MMYNKSWTSQLGQANRTTQTSQMPTKKVYTREFKLETLRRKCKNLAQHLA
jgi:hypothetical protein